MKKFIKKTLHALNYAGEFITSWTIITGGSIVTVSLVYVLLEKLCKKYTLPISVMIAIISEFGWCKVSDNLLKDRGKLKEFEDFIELKSKNFT